MFGLLACEQRAALREWQASDHQPPPAVTPEGQGAGEDTAAGANTRAAQALWESRCATCHGADGRGNGPGKPPVAQIPDFTSRDYVKKHSDAELHAIIKNGRGLMPAFGAELTDLGIDAMVAHVRSLAR
ncbi:MAG TPA: c-type cytochrome [Polyangiales bacterium]|nr:c-type cytochrome [Polyangiales bacterium]